MDVVGRALSVSGPRRLRPAERPVGHEARVDQDPQGEHDPTGSPRATRAASALQAMPKALGGRLGFEVPGSLLGDEVEVLW